MNISNILKKVDKYEAKIKLDENNMSYKQKLNEYYNKVNERIYGGDVSVNKKLIQDVENEKQNVKLQMGSGPDKICEEARKYTELINQYKKFTYEIHEKVKEYRNSNEVNAAEYIDAINEVNSNTNVMLLRIIELYNKFLEQYNEIIIEMDKCYEEEKQKKTNKLILSENLKEGMEETKREIKHAADTIGTTLDATKLLEQIEKKRGTIKAILKLNLQGGFSKDQKKALTNYNKKYDELLTKKSDVITKSTKRSSNDTEDKEKQLVKLLENSIETFNKVVEEFLSTEEYLLKIFDSMLTKLDDCKCGNIKIPTNCEIIQFDKNEEIEKIEKTCIREEDKKSENDVTINMNVSDQFKKDKKDKKDKKALTEITPKSNEITKNNNESSFNDRSTTKDHDISTTSVEKPEDGTENPKDETIISKDETVIYKDETEDETVISKDEMVNDNNDEDGVNTIVLPKYTSSKQDLDDPKSSSVITTNTPKKKEDLNKILEDLRDQNAKPMSKINFRQHLSDNENADAIHVGGNDAIIQIGGVVDKINLIKNLRLFNVMVKNALKHFITLRLLVIPKNQIHDMLKEATNENSAEKIMIFVSEFVNCIYPSVNDFGNILEINTNEKNKYINIYKNLGYGIIGDDIRIPLDIFLNKLIYKVSSEEFRLTDEINEIINKFLLKTSKSLELTEGVVKLLKDIIHEPNQATEQTIDYVHNQTKITNTPEEIYTFCKIRIDPDDNDHRSPNIRFFPKIIGNNILNLGYNDTHIPFYDNSVGFTPDILFNFDDKKFLRIGTPKMDIMITEKIINDRDKCKYEYNIGNVILGYAVDKPEHKFINTLFKSTTGILNKAIRRDHITIVEKADKSAYILSFTIIPSLDKYGNQPDPNEKEKTFKIEVYNDMHCKKNKKKINDNFKSLGFVLETNSFNTIREVNDISDLSGVVPYMSADTVNQIFRFDLNNVGHLRVNVMVIKMLKVDGIKHLYFNIHGKFNADLYDKNDNKRIFKNFVLKKNRLDSSGAEKKDGTYEVLNNEIEKIVPYIDNRDETTKKRTIGFIDKFRFVYNNNYIFGPFTQIFNEHVNNKVLTNGGTIGNDPIPIDSKINIVKNFLNNGKNVTIIGYGSSGSGKTSTLVYLSYRDKTGKDREEEGVLIELCNFYLTNKMGGKNVRKLEVNFVEFMADVEEMMLNPGEDKVKKNSKEYGKNVWSFDDKGIFDKKIFEKKENDNKWVTKTNDIEAGKVNGTNDSNDVGKIPLKNIEFGNETEISRYIFELMENVRYIRPTPNNKVSSRSHVLIFVKFITDENNSGPYLIICDFAGVENKFNCDDQKTIEDFNAIKVISNDKKSLVSYYEEIKKLKLNQFENNDDIQKYLINYFSVKNIKYIQWIDITDRADANKKFILDVKASGYKMQRNVMSPTIKGIYSFYEKEILSEWIGHKIYKIIYDEATMGKFDYSDQLYNIFPIFQNINKTEKKTKSKEKLKNKAAEEPKKNENMIGYLNTLHDKLYNKVLSVTKPNDAEKKEITKIYKNLLSNELIIKIINLTNYLVKNITINDEGFLFVNLLFSSKSTTEILKKNTNYFRKKELLFATIICFFIMKKNEPNKFIKTNVLENFINYAIKELKMGTISIILYASNLNFTNGVFYDERILDAKMLDRIKNSYILNFNLFLAYPVLAGIQQYINSFDESTKHECTKRVYEGEFINGSLGELKKNIAYILNKIQRKNMTNIPKFDVKCVPFQCNELSESCFNENENIFNEMEHSNGVPMGDTDKYMDKIFSKKTPVHGITAPIMLQEINDQVCGVGKMCVDNMVFCVFLIVNMSKDFKTNNPPVTPFVNLNQLKMELIRMETLKKNRLLSIEEGTKNNLNNYFKLYHMRNDTHSDINYDILCRFYTKDSGEIYNLFYNKLSLDKNFNLPLNTLLWSTEGVVRSTINNFIEELLKSKDLTGKINILIKIIDTLTKSNDVTTIGTLEYLDSMAKFGICTIPCNYEINPDFIGGEKKQINHKKYKLLLKNTQDGGIMNVEHYLDDVIHPNKCDSSKCANKYLTIFNNSIPDTYRKELIPNNFDEKDETKYNLAQKNDFATTNSTKSDYN